MNRVAIVALLALGAAAIAQDTPPTIQTERDRNEEFRKRAAAIEAHARDDRDALKTLIQRRERVSEKRKDAAAAYAAGEGLPVEDVRDRIDFLLGEIRRVREQSDETKTSLATTEPELRGIDDERAASLKSMRATRDADPNKTDFHAGEWNTLETDRPNQYDRIRAALGDRADTLRSLAAAETETLDELVKALSLHRRENLLLRSPDRLDWTKTSQALSEVRTLPAWFSRAGKRIGSYFSDPELRPGILRWAGSALLLGLIVIFLGRGMLRRASRLEQRPVEGEPGHDRTVHAVYRFGRRAVHLLLIALVPWSAAVMLPDLPGAISNFLLDIAQFTSLYYVVWSVYRELLRPDAPERALVPVEPPVRRSLGVAIGVLLVFCAAVRIAIIALHAVGYGNETGLLLLELTLILGATVALSGIVFRKDIFWALLPKGDSSWARLTHALGRFARPFLRLLLPLILGLTVLRYEALAKGVLSLSTALLAVVIAGTLVFQLLSTIWIQSISRSYADDPESEAGTAARAAGLFALRVAVFLLGLWCIPLLAGTSRAEFEQGLQIGLPFSGKDSALTVWNLGAALVAGIIFWSGVHHAKALLQYQVLARTRIDRSAQYTITTLSGYVMLTIGMLIALHPILNLVALGTIVAALSVGIGFGMQDIVANFISGIILLFERPIRVGDTIEIGANRGLVRTINIRATTVQTRDNIFILVPNRNLVSNEVVNYGYNDPKIRLAIPVGVSYSSDPEQVRDVLIEVAQESTGLLKHPAPQVEFLEFGDSSLNFRLMVWIQRAEQRQRATSDLNFAIFKAFREAHIEIPFPQRDLHIRSAEGIQPRALPQPEAAAGGEPDPKAEPEA